MRYTEEDEQRVYEAINRVVAKEMRSPSRLPQDEFMRHIARVALDAMTPEPSLEDVLRAQHVYNIQIEPAGPNYYAEVVSAAHDRRTGTGATIEEAIRAAVADAKGDE